MSVQDTHEEKETLSVDVYLPGHEPRTTSPIFCHSRLMLLQRDGSSCRQCGVHDGLEAHHSPIERAFADGVDWAIVRAICESGEWGWTQAQRDAAKAFDWTEFDPADPYIFIDNMLVNGMLLCKDHHIRKDTGIHALPHPIWEFQRFAKEGYVFSTDETIHHQS